LQISANELQIITLSSNRRVTKRRVSEALYVATIVSDRRVSEWRSAKRRVSEKTSSINTVRTAFTPD